MNESDSQPSPATPPIPNDPGQQSAGTGLPPTVAAGLAALFPLIGGIIIFLLEKKDAYVRFYALQSIYFGAATLILSVALTVISSILAFIPVLGWLISGALFVVFSLSVFIFWLMNVVKAFSGIRWEMPYLGEMVRVQLEKLDESTSA